MVLYDTLGLHLGDISDLEHLLNETSAKVLIFSRDTRPDLRAKAYSLGASAWVSMSLHAGDLVRSIEATAAGEPIGEHEDRMSAVAGLTSREVEVLALITQGLSNQEIAAKLVMSVNTPKSHIRQAYRKIEATTRSQAVRWAITHGFAPADETSLAESATTSGALDLTR
ncbi:response regulator transcription factor [Nocardioides sp. NPDC000445]|uniref:response regulator transcription factor n=1 Tax=Nocardioides sp. NPDC000445 TaxID=3154257 RepID=UPI003326B2F2